MQRELDQLTRQIEKTEAEIAELGQQMAVPGFYERPQTEVQATLDKMAALQTSVDTLFERWEELADE